MSHSFTLRLSDEEQAILQTLADQLDSNRSDALRHALRLAVREHPKLDGTGIFTPINSPDAEIIVRLVQGAASQDG